MTMTREKVALIRADMDAALASIAAKHGIEKFKIGTIKFNEDYFRCAIESTFVGGDSPDMKSLKVSATFLGFKEEIAGATIKYGPSQEQYEVIGLKRTKLILKSLKDDKNYVAKVDDVKRALRNSGSTLVA